MKKNVASQVVGAQMVSASDGSAFTGAVTCYVTGNGGTQAVGSVGSGACTHEGNGFHTYTPAQAETNYDHVAFTFIGTGAVPVTVQIYTTFPQTGDNYTRLGAPVGASLSADIAAVQADTDNLQTRIPAALVGGRMDASVGAMANDVLTAASIANGAIDRATLAADTGWQSIRSGTAQAGAAGTITLDASASPTTDFYAGLIVSLTGGAGAGQARVITAYNGTTKVATIAPNWATAPDNSSTFAILPFAHPTGVQGNLTGSVGSVAAGGITAASIATGAVDADAIAADAVAEIQSGLATASAITALDNKLGSPSNLGSGANLAANLVDIESQTDDIGVAGAGLTNLGDARLANLDAAVSTRATPAQVNTEVDTALADVNLDHLVGTPTGIPAIPAGTYLDQIMDDGTASYDRTTDSLQAIRDHGDAAWITGGGGGGSGAASNTAVITFLREFHQSTTLDGIALVATDGEILSNPTLAAGDVKVSVDGSTPVNIATLPSVVGGSVRVQLSADELFGRCTVVTFDDQTVPREWQSVKIIVDTYGHVLARHAFNLNSGSVEIGDKTGFRLSTVGVMDILQLTLVNEPLGVPSWPMSVSSALSWIAALSRNTIVSTAVAINLKNDEGSANIASATIAKVGSTVTRDEWS